MHGGSSTQAHIFAHIFACTGTGTQARNFAHFYLYKHCKSKKPAGQELTDVMVVQVHVCATVVVDLKVTLRLEWKRCEVLGEEWCGKRVEF